MYLLLEKGRATAPELAQVLEVSVRTIYRDLEALSMAGVPVYTLAGKGGGVGLLPGYTVDKALFSDDEQAQLLFAIQSLQAAGQQVEGLLQKLGAVFQKAGASWIEVDFSRWGVGRLDNEKFEQLKNAVLQKKVLSILYCGASGRVGQREVKPFKLIFKDKSWYLNAFCTTADDLRLFKVSRIMNLAQTGESFTESFESPPPDEAPPPFSEVPLKLHFSPRVTFRVFDEFDPTSVEIQPDGSMVVTTMMPLDNWVEGYLLTFGEEVEILEPLPLRKRMANLAEKICNHHRT